MAKTAEKCKLDVKDLSGKVLSTEDKIMCKLFYEKGLSKYELGKELKVSYESISENITKMEKKGYVIRRIQKDDFVYFLTVAGVYELEYRINTEYFLYLHSYLEMYSTNAHDVEAFLRNGFYNLYSEGVWDESTLVEQFTEWAGQRNIAVKKLK